MPEHSKADREPISLAPKIDDRVYVFHHIPRCGGTSCRDAFSEWFQITDDYRQGWATGDALQGFQQHPVELSLLRQGDMLAGHL